VSGGHSPRTTVPAAICGGTRAGSGFSLIELSITLVVLAILLAVATPTYTAYVTRSNRAEGWAALELTAQQLERCFTVQSRYDDADCDVSFPFLSQSGRYRIEAVTDATTFVLTATPQGSQASNDAACGALTLNEAGVRGATGGLERCSAGR